MGILDERVTTHYILLDHERHCCIPSRTHSIARSFIPVSPSQTVIGVLDERVIIHHILLDHHGFRLMQP
jgi:hypothetical protein